MIAYRVLRKIDELRQVVNLQHLIWGGDAEVVVPLHMLVSLAANGCPVIGAFEEDLLVGFSLAFFGTDVQGADRPALANLKLASKRLAVHPDYRSSGIGYQLKLQQKAFADKQGVRLITWTFDPLLSRNAHLYIRKLGGVGRFFIPDFYDEIPGQVDALGSSDRFICEWWITSRRVNERLHGSRRDLTAKQYVGGNAPIINPTTDLHGRSLPYEGSAMLGESHLLLVEIPPDPTPLYADSDYGRGWRNHLRSVLRQTFESGYIVTDFLHEEYEGRLRSFYVLGFDGGGEFE
ncbi:MAG: GNAT family N-acetyltransferase [Anaerolineales bacterium]